MKRNRFFVLGVLAAALAFGLVLAGCDDGNKGDPFTWPAELRGTRWKDDNFVNQYLTFKDDSDGDYLLLNKNNNTIYYKDVTTIGTLTATAGKLKSDKMGPEKRLPPGVLSLLLFPW